MIPIYIIHLQRDNERYDHIVSQLQKTQQNIITFIKAIDGSEINKQKCGYLTQGQAGCYLSHMKALQNIIDDNVPYAIILEDDVHLTSLFSNDVFDKIINTRINMDICWIGNSRGKWPRNPCSMYPIPSYDVSDNTNDDDNDTIFQVTDMLWKLPSIPYKDNHPVGAYGLLVSRKGAFAALNIARENNLKDPIDMVYVKHPLLEKYMTIPSIVTHCYEFDSNIANEKNNTKNNTILPLALSLKSLSIKIVIIIFLIYLLVLSLFIIRI